MTTPAPAPRLIDYRATARSQLRDFYRPYENEMRPDHSLGEILSEQKLQATYEALATPTVPETGVIGVRWRPFQFNDRWFPDPIQFLFDRTLGHKVHELFQEEQSEKQIWIVCRKRADNVFPVDSGLVKDVAQASELILIGTVKRDPPEGTTKNSDLVFLTRWKDSYGLPDEAGVQARKHLIKNVADNTIRRMKNAQKRLKTNLDATNYEELATAGRSVMSPGGNIHDCYPERANLTDGEKRALTLRFEYGCTNKEIGIEMGVSTSTAFHLVRSALEKIRRMNQ